ncbi:uncharacterized protein BT62DRAFT_963894 [Guyanagaster necrorhizus]|uniref:Uncharacterized protein n=1 Tax=Guyanagaster necrorhizus TaxID=856835 RepID=A0A9P8AVF7_9AGAR|nr:uncharacterized protein BT62DRAFT_963894 [Guyanagaster necrorhizus MCA 3950]KAG7449061.1 hypothetical protein BT62DRAFT_963894 [Guyanagaster necrorhizus MCA 3950]
MGTSELSDALNPSYAVAVPYRNRPPQNSYPEPYHPVVQPPQQYAPHRSELELAISEPQPLPPTRQTQPSTGHAVHELLRIVSATSQTQEIERKRRIAWEQEQEAKYAQRQAEMERQLFELRQELVTLRTAVPGNTQQNTGASPSLSSARNAPFLQQAQSSSLISPVPQPPGVHYPTFIQGSSSQPIINYSQQYAAAPDQQQQHLLPDESPMGAMTPSPSPHPIVPTQRSRNTASKTRKKRRASSSSSEESDSGSNSDSSVLMRDRKKKRRNHHDKRCITIHHAMRTHILLLMDVLNANDLPDSHTEGQSLKDTDPVRFVWDKTAKQSVHNARMKARIIANIKENRRRYKDLPDGEFSKKNLDSAFDQCFTTFRQKFKAQRDDREADRAKAREDRKAHKARHVSRRKIKLTNRADARLRIEAFEHIAFDGTFQLECMSSDDSDSEDDGLLCSRGYPWRSKRLIRFYEILDKEDIGDKASKPKRGVGKKDRAVGPLKEGFHLPPKGVASWMISRRWIAETQLTRSDLPRLLEPILSNLPDFDSVVQKCTILDDDSDDEYFQRTNPNTTLNLQPLSMHYNIANNSSLQYAFS